MQRLNAASYSLFVYLATLAVPVGAQSLEAESLRVQASAQNDSPESTISPFGAASQNPTPSGQEVKPAPASPQAAASGSLIIDPQIIADARAGDAEAQYKLGYDYYLGRGISQDYVQAAIWWHKAADQGYANAQNNLGVLYNSGKGVPQSYAEAYFWQNLAASRANGSLQAEFAKNRDNSANKLSFFERLRVQKRASRWFAEHPLPSPKVGDVKTETATPSENKSPEATPQKPGQSRTDHPKADQTQPDKPATPNPTEPPPQ